MDKLSYDLASEVIDELDPEDVPELMKTDRRFRLTLLQKPARIFGKQIQTIHIYSSRDFDGNDYHHWLSIGKFPESSPLYFDLFSHDALLLSQVERCSVLKISDPYCDWLGKRKLSALKKVFANLKQVHKFDVYIKQDIFNNSFKAEVTNRASLTIRYERTTAWRKEQQPLLSLISGSLQNCKMISFDEDPTFFDPTVHSALSKTQLELLMILIWSGNVKSTTELIINSGIPSENKEVACFVLCEWGVKIDEEIKSFSGIRHTQERNKKTFFKDAMMEMLRKHELEHYAYDASDAPVASDAIHCYWKRVDANRDCIYVVTRFFLFAKYVSSIQRKLYF